MLDLLDHPKSASFEISALVRSAEKLGKLDALKLGVRTVEGSATDFGVLKANTEDVDIVIDAFDSDNMEGVKALLGALKANFEVTKRKVKLVHFSGCAIVVDKSVGKYKSDVVTDDADTAAMAAIPDDAPHRNVDLEVLKAHAEGYIDSYIIIPGALYGDVDNVLSKSGIQRANKPVSVAHIAPVVGLGVPATVGGGFNIWPFVHFEDVVSLTRTVFDNLDVAPKGTEGYYFAETVEADMRFLAHAAIEAVRGQPPSPTEERALTEDEEKAFFPGQWYTFIGVLAANCRCKGSRGRTLGWKPAHESLDELKEDLKGIALSLKK
ncbi:hypothetical protein CYLTODRAFT_389922 [Cylindrobasidium torrendii FP15055 ss-10]|uniref:NAD(P)-binding protein n=1 Tax=Cylindrobasidium torrendii FP15055 ss-10 TaxID=1314674 RepID=A0A0D7BNH4_9AGAR|nr:hypothetical protein CYLTODRAFT_389922 [Cylindrobasidium torrendii FP15055 ss-10]